MKNIKFDYVLGIATLIIIGIGILVLASASCTVSQENFGNTTYYIFHQLLFGILPGIILAIVFFFLPLSWFKRFSWIVALASVFFMILVFFPSLGIAAGGASRWLNLRFFSFQPSELLKLASVLYIAAWLSSPKRSGNKGLSKNTLIPFLVIAGVLMVLLLLQSDMGTFGIIALLALAMYFSSGTPAWHTVLIIFLGILGGAVMLKTASYRLMRLKVMLGIVDDPMGLGFQLKQMLIAVGSGGILGLGLGSSGQKYGFVPQSMSDSIFAIFSEETGFVGSVILISLFVIILWRSLKIAKLSEDKFSKLFAIGFGSWICLQALINIGAMIGVLPLTGIPLPFISYGGSHIMVEIAGAGILLNISRGIKK